MGGLSVDGKVLWLGGAIITKSMLSTPRQDVCSPASKWARTAWRVHLSATRPLFSRAHGELPLNVEGMQTLFCHRTLDSSSS